MVLVTAAVEFCPALHAQISVLIMGELQGFSRGKELERERERERVEGETK